MPKGKPKKATKSKAPELKVTYVPELCHREYADAFDVRYKQSGVFAIAFISTNPREANIGSVHSVIYMESGVVEALAEALNKGLAEYRKRFAGKKE